jgi:phosphatidylinositol glycan class V
MSNIPLFLLAAPSLTVLVISGLWGLGIHRKKGTFHLAYSSSLPAIALPQLALALTALVLYHVQIILRIASGYPVWYWWIAQLLIDEQAGRTRLPHRIVQWMVMYSVVQTALYAAFLPPA